MANLPPKPESPVKDERRHDPRGNVTTARPMAPVPSPHSPHATPHYRGNERSYIPRTRPETETYIPTYTNRRPPRDWERERRDYDRRRDSRRDWREPNRRDSRPNDYGRDDDRFRRQFDSGYHRSRSPRRSRSPHYHRSPPPRRRSRSRTRSPSPQRRGPPARPRVRASSRSRSPHPQSPPPKRIKLGNHSISDSPRTPRDRSRSRVRSYSRTHSPSPFRPSDHNRMNKTPPPSIKEKVFPPRSPIVTSRPLSTERTNAASHPSPVPTTFAPDDNTVVAERKVVEIMPTTKAEAPEPTIPSPKHYSLQHILEHPTVPQTEVSVKVEVAKEESLCPHPRTENIARQSSPTSKPDVKVDPRGRSHSPPKGPRAHQWRKTSKSPPKGPRKHGTSTPSTAMTPMPPPAPAPAPPPMSMYPTGPRADRRPPKELKEETVVLRSLEFSKISPPANERWAKGIPLPTAKGIPQTEVELARYRSSRAHHSKDHASAARNTRRALHELDMATIDLRMAEARRKVADAQLEKAKQGTLGMDFTPPDTAPD